MKIESVKVQRLYMQVANQLSELIGDGTLEAGQRLPSERELATRFNVSRPSIREAMIALEVAGAIDIRSGSGIYVKPHKGARQPALLNEDNPGPMEILEARLHFESKVAALAAERIQIDEIQPLQNAIHALAAENKDSKGKEHADRTFHLLIAKAAKNSAMLSIITWLWDLRDASTVSQFFHEKLRKSGNKPVIADHQAILDAIVAKDPQRASQAMQQHLGRVIEIILAGENGQ